MFPPYTHQLHKVVDSLVALEVFGNVHGSKFF